MAIEQHSPTTTASAGAERAADFRAPTPGRRAPRAVADAGGGTILAVADVAGAPADVFRALTTAEVEHWWRYPGRYHQKDWAAEVRVGGPWRVTVVLDGGGEVHAWGEFCALRVPELIVMTRRFDAHPFLGERETTITYRLEPHDEGGAGGAGTSLETTRVTVRDEGFVGRAEAAYGNAEIWEQVLGWLDGYLGRARSQEDR
jgi:uncharacterized protein YndB with AHSA1/START domain